MEQQEFEFFKKKIFERYGFDFSLYNKNYVERRIKVRMMANKIESYVEYWKIIEKDPQEYNKLLEVFNINVTEFFRDIVLWDLLKKEIFGEMFSKKINTGFRMFKIWSAGCATGEEPYTIAIVLKETIYDKLKEAKVQIKIIATDNDEDAIKKAKEGVYKENSVKNLISFFPFILKKYFLEKTLQNNEKIWIIKDDIKNMVEFRKHDMLKEEPIQYNDIIFCRNVMIYFTQETKNALLKKFYKALNNNGFLILGKTENIFLYDIFKIFNISERIYIKN